MEKVSVSITAEQLERINSRADEDGTGRSAALRAILDECAEVRAEYESVREEYEAEITDLEGELEDVRAERDDLRRQLAAANQRIDEVNDVIDHVRGQRSAAEKQVRRQDLKDRAGILTKAKWAVFGMDLDDDAEA